MLIIGIVYGGKLFVIVDHILIDYSTISSSPHEVLVFITPLARIWTGMLKSPTLCKTASKSWSVTMRILIFSLISGLTMVLLKRSSLISLLFLGLKMAQCFLLITVIKGCGIGMFSFIDKLLIWKPTVGMSLIPPWNLFLLMRIPSIQSLGLFLSLSVYTNQSFRKELSKDLLVILVWKALRRVPTFLKVKSFI